MREFVNFVGDALFIGQTSGVSPPPPPPPSANYFAESGATVPFSNAHGSPAQYYANINKTVFAWEATSPPGAGGSRHVRCKAFNHTTGLWEAEYVCGTFGIANDNHGQPSQCRDNDGYIHIAYGAHNSLFRSISTLAPNDITAWRENATVAGNHTYMHLHNVGGVLYNLHDISQVTSVMPTTGITAGVPTWGAAVSLIDVGQPASELYMGNGVVIGNNIHFVACKSTSGTGARQHVYYFVYETDTGDVRNFADDVTIDVLDLPVDATEADTSFRLFTHSGGTSGNVTNVPQLIYDTNGHPHILFSDGPLTVGPFTLKHIWHNGTAWQAPSSIGASMSWPIDSMGIHAMAGGKVAAVWPEDESSLWTFGGGNIRRAEWTAGTWSTPETIITAGATYPMNSAVAVVDGIAAARAVATEMIADNNPASESGELKLFAIKEDGSLLTAPALVHTAVNAETDTVCDRFTTPPTMQRYALYDMMLTRIKNIGISKFDGFYILAGADDQCILQNLIQNNYNLTASGGLTFLADRGVTGNGTTGFYSTGFIPSTAGGNMTQNSAHLGVYLHVADDNNAVAIASQAGAPSSFIIPRMATNNMQIRVSTSTSTSASNSDSSGHFIANRSASNAQQGDRNGVQLISNTQASIGLPASEIRLFSNSALFSDNRISIAHFGADLGAVVTGDRTKLYHAARAWQLSVGNF